MIGGREARGMIRPHVRLREIFWCGEEEDIFVPPDIFPSREISLSLIGCEEQPLASYANAIDPDAVHGMRDGVGYVGFGVGARE